MNSLLRRLVVVIGLSAPVDKQYALSVVTRGMRAAVSMKVHAYRGFGNGLMVMSKGAPIAILRRRELTDANI